MIKEFREFALRGNVLDLAVGIIIGAAFSSIVNSLVNDIIMPPIGFILGDVDFSDLFITLGSGNYGSLQEAKDAGAATINYGFFINQLITFLIVAYAVFLLVKAVNRMLKTFEREEAQSEAPAEPDTQERLVATLDRLAEVLEKKA
jgi:large conductance mechanosensitive channel